IEDQATAITVPPGMYDVTQHHPTWCTLGAGGYTVQCFVPFSYIEGRLTTPPDNLCGVTVNIAFNLDPDPVTKDDGTVNDGATCSLSDGTLTGVGNFFKYGTLTFTCHDDHVCNTYCCC